VVTQKTSNRKADHIKICLDNKAQARDSTTGFEDIYFVHRALPEIDKNKIDMSTTVLGHTFSAPLMVGAMTGGTAEATKINATIAEAVEQLNLGMGIGSQRAALEDPNLKESFLIARKKAPTAFLVANIGAVQLSYGYGLKEAIQAVKMINADALAIHLNSLQETTQPEGQTNFKGVIGKIGEIARKLDKPVIVKETGAGLAAEEAKRLESEGVKAIDVAGSGGTSFAAVEYYRWAAQDNQIQKRLGEAFWDWGIPTAASLAEVTQTVKIPVIASGGVRTGNDVAKALAFGASLSSLSQPVLQAAIQGTEETIKMLSLLIEELKNVMFLVGAEKADDLSKTAAVVTGKTGEWLKIRGFNIEQYAKRGRC